jgi:hypothetical protein
MSTAIQKPAAWINRITARIADERSDKELSAAMTCAPVIRLGTQATCQSDRPQVISP